MNKNNKQNLAQIVESWTPAIKQLTNNAVNESNPDKLAWMCEYAHNHTMALNEEAVGGVSFPYQTLNNTMGIGNAVPASFAGQTAADQQNGKSFGSGDKWPSLLPMALQVAARTIGFDLVNTVPFQGPTGVLPFLDYVYAGSKEAYGGTPARDGATANPQIGVNGKEPAYEMYDAPHAFRCKIAIDPSTGTKAEAVAAIAEACDENGFIEIGDTTKMKVQFIGLSRLSADPMFKVMPGQTNIALGKVFGAENKTDVKLGNATFTLKGARLISALEDQIQGFTGAGKYDSDRWTGTFQDPHHLYEPMDRGTGEMQYPRQMNLKVFTKFVSVGTQSIAVAVTQEQVQDLQKQWGIDVLKLVETAAINELSQSINKHILSRLFALGWRNHVEAYRSEGINLNISLTGVEDTKTCVTYLEVDSNEDPKEVQVELPVPAITKFGDFENSDTVFKKIAVNLLYAGNIIMNRGRRGPANFIVTNAKIATMLQSNSQFAFSPIANTFNQNNGSLYPMGTIAGMTLYVDPLMRTDDTRVLVGRKGGKEEPGVVFSPYIMAESVRLIAEHTAAPKVVIKSRYALIDLGWYPELNYLTFYVKTPDAII
jgi:hypothetical protein